MCLCGVYKNGQKKKHNAETLTIYTFHGQNTIMCYIFIIKRNKDRRSLTLNAYFSYAIDV